MQSLAANRYAGYPPAALLFDCIRQLGERHSNPVLELLRDVPRFVQGGKYPQPALAFGEGRWRSYYHSHATAQASTGEHGHFHLFSQHPDGWAHLAALAMDRDGQPLRWIITNRWVTGGEWGQRDALLAAIDALVPANEPDLLRRWLAGLLQLYAGEFGDLLAARDARIDDLLQGRSPDEILDDRSLYELARAPIDLSEKLTSLLTGERL